MAESLVSPGIDKLVGLLADEVKSLKGVERQVKSLKSELEIIEPLLKDAEAKLEKGDMCDTMKAWLNQIRKEASRMEEVIDEYRYHVRQQQGQSGFVSSLRKAGCFIKTLKPRYEMASKIRRIKESLSEIKGRGQGYGLRPLEEGQSSRATDVQVFDGRLSSLFIEEDELVGIESTSVELVAKLVEGTSTRLIISFVGEGGIGKTTLVKKVYDDEAVRRHFESDRAWITVSKPYSLTKVLKKMKQQICESEDCIDTIEELIDSLRKYLQTKRYVIVFDDVWEESFWDDIKSALPSNKEGSRIIITTRNAAVANSCKETPYDLVQNLQPWSLTLAWELFCKKTFKYEFQGICPPELKQLSIEIVRKCQGLPLVIAAIASLLATKEKVELQWQRVLNDLNSKAEFNSQLGRIQKILALSCYDLPCSLKSCFLYFGIFPEDYSISDERLCRLWIAEGFVEKRGGKTSDEVAKECLNELIQRNLISIDPNQIFGEGKWFRVHDLMHEVILSRADDVCFSQIWDDKNSKCRGKGRRLTISGGTKNVLENVESSGIRSIFFSNTEGPLTESFLLPMFKKFKLLEILDFGDAQVDTLPKELGCLFCLKYLSLRYANLKELPKSIGRLYNLQSLDIRDTLIHELPKEVNKLTNLQHLLAYGYNYRAQNCFDFVRGVRMQEGYGNLKELQTLTLVEESVGGVGLVKELEKLTKLRWLGVAKITTEIGRGLFNTIGKLNNLERLYLSSINEDDILSIEYISSPPYFLQDLILGGRLERLPEWISKLPNLRGLSLKLSRLIDDPSRCLKGLPNLESLELVFKAYEGEQLHFQEAGFQKLKRLVLIELDRLQVVKADKGALPLLEQFHIRHCLELKEVFSIQRLRSIKEFMFDGRIVTF